MVIARFLISLPCLLVICRGVWPLPLPWAVKVAIALVLLVGSQFHLLSRLSSGSVFAPEFPRPLVILFNWVFGGTLFLALMLLALDLAVLVTMPFREVSWPDLDRIRVTLAGLAGSLAALGVWQAIRVPPLKDVEIAIPGLSPQFDGYRLVQLTDMHISRLFTQGWTRAVVERSNALGVDAIVITGDLVDGSVEARRGAVAPLRDLRARDGVFVVPGNHEYFFDYLAWMRHDAGLGMHVLANAHAVLARGDGRLILAGVTDQSAIGSEHPSPDLDAALNGAPAGVPIVLLDHQPKQARQAAARGVSLQLSGHTHGGMIRGLDRLVARGNGGFVSGRYDVGGMSLYVNNGTGLWPGFALRLGVPSELTRITLRRAPSQR